MSNENLNEELNNETPAENSVMPSEDLNKIIQAKVDEELANIKDKLNSAYSQRDEAVQKAVAFEEEKKRAEITRLEQEGKHKEASDMKLTEITAKLAEKKSKSLS